MKHVFRLTIAALWAMPLACGHEATSTEPLLGEVEFEPMCQIGCVDPEPDPNPEAPGYFMGSEITNETCWGNHHTDVEQDQLSDFCEKELALQFSPELMYWDLDNIAGEPRWAARPIVNGLVRIAYLLSYYRDEGSTVVPCNLPPPAHHWSCEGHNGDSEAVYLDIQYDEGTSHWYLATARYARHEYMAVYPLGECLVIGTQCYYLEFPDRYAGSAAERTSA